MDPKDALAILEQVAAKHLGTLADHQAIQQALDVVRALLGPKEE